LKKKNEKKELFLVVKTL